MYFIECRINRYFIEGREAPFILIPQPSQHIRSTRRRAILNALCLFATLCSLCHVPLAAQATSSNQISLLRKATEANPSDIKAWYKLGAAYANLNRWNESLVPFRKIVRIEPNNDSGWYNLGLAYCKLERWKDALGPLRLAVNINPKCAKAWDQLGSAYMHLHQEHDSIEAHRQAVDIDPKFSNAWFNLGLDYILAGDRGAAAKVVLRLRELDTSLADELASVLAGK